LSPPPLSINAAALDPGFSQVEEFTQEQIRRMDLVYVPPAGHLVSDERTVTFTLAKNSPDSDEEQRLHFRVRLLPLEHPDHPGPRFKVPNPTITIPSKVGKNFEISCFLNFNTD